MLLAYVDILNSAYVRGMETQRRMSSRSIEARVDEQDVHAHDYVVIPSLYDRSSTSSWKLSIQGHIRSWFATCITYISGPRAGLRCSFMIDSIDVPFFRVRVGFMHLEIGSS